MSNGLMRHYFLVPLVLLFVFAVGVVFGGGKGLGWSEDAQNWVLLAGFLGTLTLHSLMSDRSPRRLR